jgi:rod shape-determining protein MreC
MAPSRNRRLGFSRKVRYSLFAGYVAAIVGAVFGLALTLLARFDPQVFALIRGTALDITTPITSVGRSAVRGVDSIGGEVAAYFRAGSQNRALREELAVARRKLIAARATEFENRRLKRIVKLVERQTRPVAVARLVGSNPAGHRRFATLRAGTSDGVRPGQPVRSADGLIGRVFEAGLHASRLLLLTDGGSALPVRIVRSGAAALAIGRGDGTLELRAIVGGRSAFKRGDMAITSGVGGIYAPGVPVAIIVATDGEIALARPLADPAAVDFVIVEPIYQPPYPPPAAPRP